MPGMNAMGPAGAGPGTGKCRGRCRNTAMNTEMIGWGAARAGRRFRDGFGNSGRRRWMRAGGIEEQTKRNNSSE